MNYKKILILSILAIFCIGMAMSSVSAAKVVKIPTKKDKYVTKHYGSYKIQTYKFKTGLYQQVCGFIYKRNGNMLDNRKYSMKVPYKRNGKWRCTGWVRGCISATYNNVKVDPSDKIGKIYIKIY